MNSKRTILVLLVGLGFYGGTMSRARADEWDQRSVITFSGGGFAVRPKYRSGL